MRDLTGKVAWVTGAGSGIGEAGAVALAAAGMEVVLSGRRPAPLKDVARRIEGVGGKCRVEPLDVSDKAAVQGVVDRIESESGRLDVLINSAGINPRERNWHNVSLDDWDSVIRIDLDGAFYCSKLVLPLMKKQNDGLIINISSWAGKYVGVTTGPAYTAAKHAMNAMNESLNMEACNFGIRACAVCPGEVSTPILDNRPIPVSDEDRARMVQSDDMGEIILFLTQLPAHVCINELTVSPTWNRGYVRQAQAVQQL
jgi:NADP-dependent 3-hydroxy acid dehydrogenase YdfG